MNSLIPEFKFFCLDKAMNFFELGFKGCESKLQANDYLEAEHPTPFLNWENVLDEFLDEGEVADKTSEQEAGKRVRGGGPSQEEDL